jgi:hypothetical protein
MPTSPTTLTYKINQKRIVRFKGGGGQTVDVNIEAFQQAVRDAHNVIDQISAFEVNIFEILGMRNLSAFVGELYAASLIRGLGGQYIKNPHQDGYPDLLLMDARGKALYQALKANGQIREKSPFSPFGNGGIEVKATCGSVPTPDRCRRLGLEEKPDIGDQRIGVLMGYDWKAHHRETNNLLGILWDFIDGVPRIIAVFFSSTLEVDHWGKIIQPKTGGGRTTSVSIMSRDGVRNMYDNWILALESDPRYSRFLNRYNGGTIL